MDEFQITYVYGGALITATTVLSVSLYPVWGYLFDMYSRRLLISIAGVIWGFTTWLNTLPRSFAEFFITRTLTGIDNTPPSGIESLISDYFPPRKRGNVLRVSWFLSGSPSTPLVTIAASALYLGSIVMTLRMMHSLG